MARTPWTTASASAACTTSFFDKDVLGVTVDWRITVSGNFIGRSPAAKTHVLSLAGQPANAPQLLYSSPKTVYIAWHQREVFKHPARMAAPIA